MAQDEVDEKVLKETFNRLFRALPGFLERYPDVVDTVKSVFFPPKSEGKFAFVEFVDEVLTSTAIAMSGFELHGYWIRAFESFSGSSEGPRAWGDRRITPRRPTERRRPWI